MGNLAHTDIRLRLSPRALAWLAFAAVSVAMVLLIPSHMDEYGMYHALACSQAAQQVNVWREACGAYPISIGPFQYERSYGYIGAASSVLYAPFHAVWNSVWMNYALGAAFVVLQVVGLARSFRLPRRLLPALAMFFPLAFSSIHDGGPTRISMTVLAWTPYLVTRFARNRSLFAAIGVIAGWTVAIEDKAFFAYLMPGAAVLTLAALHMQSATDRRTLTRAGLVIGAASASAMGFLAAARVGDESYLSSLRAASPAAAGVDVVNGIGLVLRFTVDWPYYAHRVNDFSSAGGTYLPHTSPTYGSLPLVLTVTVSLLVLLGFEWVWRRARTVDGDRGHLAGLLIAAWLTLCLGAVAAGGWANHHFSYAQLPLAVLLARAVEHWSMRDIVIVLGGLSLASTVAIATTPSYAQVGRGIDTAVRAALADGARPAIVNCGSWGCYYTYSLLNLEDVPVTYADTASQAGELLAVAGQRGATVYEVCANCGPADVVARFPGAAVAEIASGTSDWRVFRVSPS